MKFARMLVALLVLSALAWATTYKLTDVRRLDYNIYVTRDGLVIKTKLCKHVAIGGYAAADNATYDDKTGKIIWEDGDTPCDVVSLYRSDR